MLCSLRCSRTEWHILMAQYEYCYGILLLARSGTPYDTHDLSKRSICRNVRFIETFDTQHQLQPTLWVSCLTSDNVYHELQRWSLINVNIPRNKQTALKHTLTQKTEKGTLCSSSVPRTHTSRLTPSGHDHILTIVWDMNISWFCLLYTSPSPRD